MNIGSSFFKLYKFKQATVFIRHGVDCCNTINNRRPCKLLTFGHYNGPACPLMQRQRKWARNRKRYPSSQSRSA